jgi:hypothetical protein
MANIMDLNGRRRELNRLLRNELSEFVVATVPDHPLLMRGPDFLIGGDSTLTAVFSPSKAEQRDNRLLANRLTLSRLAMPPHSRNILLLPEEPQGLDGGKFSDDFAAVIEWRDRSEISKIARDSEFEGSQREIPKEIQRAAMRQFSDVMQITSVMRYLDERRKHDFIESENDNLSKNIYLNEDNIAIVNIKKGNINSKKIQSLINKQVSASYSLDNSVPYPSDGMYYGLAMVEDLPEFRSDPDKLLRAAAFGGWAIVSDRQRNAAPELLKRLAVRREQRTAWR